MTREEYQKELESIGLLNITLQARLILENTCKNEYMYSLENYIKELETKVKELEEYKLMYEELSQ